MILYDGANGIGALAMEEFMKHLQDSLKVTMYNKGEGILNHMCGADYVKACCYKCVFVRTIVHRSKVTNKKI